MERCYLSNESLTVFPIQRHRGSMLTLPLTRSRSSQEHDLYKSCRTTDIDASCQVSLKSDHRFQKSFLKGFYHIWAWRPSWSFDLDDLYIHWFPHPIDASHKICHKLAKQFQRRRCLTIMVIYIYIAWGWGHMSPLSPKLFRIINIQSYSSFPARFSLLIFPIELHR